MKTYDPLQEPDPAEWQSLDEHEQIALVLEYHRKADVQLSHELLHATIHVIVENQIALGDEPRVRGTLHRLIGGGLSRHDAIHAIGSVLASHMQELLREGSHQTDRNEAYFNALGTLSAAKWQKQLG